MAINQTDETTELRARLRDVPGVSAEDTRSELLERARENQGHQAELRHKIDNSAEKLEVQHKDTLSEEDAVTLVKAHLAALEKIHDKNLRFFATAAMAHAGEKQAAYKSQLSTQDPAAAAEVEAAAREDRRRAAEKEERKASASGASRLEPTAREKYEAEVRQRAQQAEELRERLEREQVHQAHPPSSSEPRQRGARDPDLTPPAANSVDVQRSGRELERPELIMPRRIVQTYSEVDGKFFAKDSNRLMFEDKGEKLATSGTNKELIADMVTLARAKQWESLKLTGSQEFRREAWLQAESQGLKTQGYTPKAEDLAALQVLTQERSTNSITPLQERKPQQQQQDRVELGRAAPRYNINKNQAAMHAEASKNIATNIQVLGKQPGMANRSAEDLTKLAYWRGIVQEENKHQPTPIQEEAVARFDTQAQDPQFVKKIDQETRGSIDDKTTHRAQKRATPELSL